MLRCLIVDDEPLAIQLLADYVARSPELELAGSFTNAIEALQSLDQLQADLLFLDIQMPDLTGVQFSKIVKGRYPVIFTTAYEQYALEGYELDVVDYLLKPVSFPRFLEAVEKAKARIRPEPARATASPAKAPRHLFIKSEYKTVKVDLDDILYLEGKGDYVRMHMASDRIMTLRPLKKFEDDLPQDRFLRVHKSFLVALDKIDYIERERIVIGDARIPIGGSYHDRFWAVIRDREG